MDEFTKNLVSLSVAHVKVERNLNEPLPSSVEVVRENGEIITIDVEYPWVPPTCSHCKEIGHVIRFCPAVTPSWTQTKKAKETKETKEIESNTDKEAVSTKIKGKGKSDPALVATNHDSCSPPSSSAPTVPGHQNSSQPSQQTKTVKQTKQSQVAPSLLPTPAIKTSNPFDALAPSNQPPEPTPEVNTTNTPPSEPNNTTSLPSDMVIDPPLCIISGDTPSAKEGKLMLRNQTNRVMTQTCPGWNYVSNHNSDEDGRIVLIWKAPADVTVLHQSKHLLTCEITIQGGHRFFFTAVYAPNSSEERTDLWCELLRLHQSLMLDNLPWALCGDFNQIIHPAEHSNPSINHFTSRMLELRDCLLQLEVFDLRFQGPLFTWTNKNNTNPIVKKLDRVLVNNHWLTCYPDGVVQALTTPSPALYEQEKEMHTKWMFLRTIEEAYFRQRSRINWLKEGDLNTTYFHRVMQMRNAFNAIRSFTSLLGYVIDDPLEMSSLAVNHFKALLAPIVLQPVTVPLDWIQNTIAYRCSPDLKQAMTKLPTPEEIRRTMFKLNANKAPGPDGFTSAFYKASWDILGAEVTSSILQFFHSSFLPSATNATILALLPKVPGASIISDFRPISCLNTLYKVVSKLLVARLKPILPDLVQKNQTAFIKGRLLVENTLLAAKLVNGYHHEKGPKRITIKVDIAKAFDTVRWEFIFSCLRGIEVPETYQRWLKACICTPSFSVGFNGHVHGYFKGLRGLRQGDPLSPYLFVLAMNCLSACLDKAAEEGKIGYHH
ncbi:PREDICTED: uncharacterized protein LOC104728863 [Camelina sativa]|uniref:Uncharacterized protein LOC104728863 n=1 Tax=Camelina sativa TaxID=90675 RepID=A0ABM0UTH7_CAMSA|nr:PREDICTED: uncharacterized protein LOC104728863 [Camelina sativa]